jgi:LuxR family maltose regulon positive regulatory protein
MGTLVAIHVQQALVERALGRRQAAGEKLGQALSLAAQSGHLRALFDDGEPVADLLAERRQAAPALVDELLAAFAERERARGAAPVAAAATAAGVVDRAAANRALEEPLGGTQLVILRLVAEGLSNQEIADRIGITLGTTKWHLNQIYGKLGVASRTQAVAQARVAKLL